MNLEDRADLLAAGLEHRTFVVRQRRAGPQGAELILQVGQDVAVEQCVDGQEAVGVEAVDRAPVERTFDAIGCPSATVGARSWMWVVSVTATRVDEGGPAAPGFAALAIVTRL
jgi:hypothetical protein